MQIIFGIHPVLECLKAKARFIERLVVAQGASNRSLQALIDLARRSGVSVRFEPRAALDRQTNGGLHQGVLAVCASSRTLDLDDLLQGLSACPLLVALDSIEDPRNLGAILRTCAASGVQGVLLPKDHSAGLSEAVAKTAAGALDYVKIARVTNLVSALKEVKEKGIWVAGVETGQSEKTFRTGLHDATGVRCGQRGHRPASPGARDLRLSGVDSDARPHAFAQRLGGSWYCPF